MAILAIFNYILAVIEYIHSVVHLSPPSISRVLFILQLKLCITSLSPQLLAATILLSVSMNSTHPDLLHFYNVFRVHPSCGMYQNVLPF
jgi:hypothetical protein